MTPAAAAINARPDRLSKWVELRLNTYLQIVWRGLESRETASEVTIKQPYPVLDRLRSRWNKLRWCNFLLFPVPDRNDDRVTG